MSDAAEEIVRWEPLPNLPELPCSRALFSYDGEILTITAAYMRPSNMAAGPVTELVIKVESPRAFKVYEEFSDPWMEKKPSLPFIRNDQENRWVYPLQEVKHSKWIERVVKRDGGIDRDDWRHLVIVTGDKTLHLMLVGEPDSVELTNT